MDTNNTDPVRARGVVDACPHCKGNPGLDCNSFGRTAPPSAPVGVKVLARDVHYAIRDAGLAPESPADDAAMRDAIVRVLAASLSQQPAAPSGQAVATVQTNPMRGKNDPHKIAYLDADLPVGTKLYAAPQQPAGVDEAMVERAVRAAERFSDEGQITFEGMRAALTAALAAQQQG